FRGNNLAFIAATEAMSGWENDDFGNDVKAKGDFLNEVTKVVVDKYPAIKAEQRGRGLMHGVACGVDGVAEESCEESFKRELVIETLGTNGEVVQYLPPLISDKDGLQKGFDIIEESIKTVVANRNLA